MKKIDVADKTHIKQLLYSNLVLGVKDDKYRSFGGFQLWWFDKERDACHCCASTWADGRKRVENVRLNKAARMLWRRRKVLFLRSRPLLADPALKHLARL